MKTRKPWTLIRTKMVPLKASRSARWCRKDEPCWHEAWKKAPPFAVNPRGVLQHRVRHVDSILWNGKTRHYHVSYLCGNGCNVDLDAIGDVLVSDPPKDRLMCLACEMRASREDLPASDQLAGRHVHKGVLVPQQTCCAGRAS